MIMALGTCCVRGAVPYLEELATWPFEATMVYTSIGDALVRLSRTHEHDASKAVVLLRSGNERLIDGALRAVAMLRMKPSVAEVDAILRFVQSLTLEDGLRFWPAAAAAGWTGKLRDAFLADCSRSSRQDLRDDHRKVSTSLGTRYETLERCSLGTRRAARRVWEFTLHELRLVLDDIVLAMAGRREVAAC